ncbi:MAG TPA: hypothetical protein VKY54_00350 [Kiloniellales bacterium]|nr:hypothetical protein [Kiloniellales bacterium]
MKGFVAGAVVALLLLVASIYAYDLFAIESMFGYDRPPYVHVDPAEFGHG